MIEVVPIQNAAHGANLCGIDLNKTITPSLMKTLTDALYEHRVIIIKNQKLTKARYLEFGRSWGTPIPHVLDHMRMPGYPELLAVGNTEKKIVRRISETEQHYGIPINPTNDNQRAPPCYIQF